MTARLPHGYTNATARAGDDVVKRYLGPDPTVRRDREVAALTLLAGSTVAVPRLVAVAEDSITTSYVAGVPGQQALLADPDGVLRTVGGLLRELQHVPVPRDWPLAGSGPVLVHGDFGPQNLLLDADTGTVAALVDFELARRGDPIIDLAWAEWIVRTHHGDLLGALGALFDGYGARPPWPQRQAAMLDGCRRALDFVRRWEAGDTPARRTWTARIAATETLREVGG